MARRNIPKTMDGPAGAGSVSAEAGARASANSSAGASAQTRATSNAGASAQTRATSNAAATGTRASAGTGARIDTHVGIDADTGTGRRARVAADVETAILQLALHQPTLGQDRVARELRERRLFVSASGVRYVWQRHGLETLEKRVRQIEQRLGKHDSNWSEDQIIARDRVRNDRQARTLGAGIAGQSADEVSRSERILAVAARLLREQGYEATSLRDVARRSHIPLGSMYYHFPSKEEMFAAVYEEGIRRLSVAARQAIATRATPWERLESACITHLEQLCGGDDFTAASIPTNMPRIEGNAKSRLTQANHAYEELFRELIDALDLRPPLSPTLARLQLLGALNWTSLWYRPDRATPKSIAVHLVRMLRHGMQATPEPQQRQAGQR